jgi:uncharacterized MAPEG superfamily protein
MTIAYWCVVLVMFLPLIWVGIAKANGSGYDNDRPREWLADQKGRAARANWAQQNSYEAFPPFAAAVIIAHLTGSEQSVVDGLACFFVACRIAHGLLYINDKSMLRSFVWLGGFGATVALFLT